jgi:hypothetical protein
MAEFAAFIDGIELDLLDGLDDASRRLAAVRAVNKVARDARAYGARMIRDQVNLPARYLSEQEKRFFVSKQATRGSLEAKITARGRATSLAQFVSGSAKVGKTGVYVEVKPGRARFMRRAFLIKLPQGGSPVTDTKFNLGLAMRLRPGETINNKLQARRVEKGLYVLYGPSVSQVFRANDGEGVANEIGPRTADRLADEFIRLIGL